MKSIVKVKTRIFKCTGLMPSDLGNPYIHSATALCDEEAVHKRGVVGWKLLRLSNMVVHFKFCPPSLNVRCSQVYATCGLPLHYLYPFPDQWIAYTNLLHIRAGSSLRQWKEALSNNTSSMWEGLLCVTKQSLGYSNTHNHVNVIWPASQTDLPSSLSAMRSSPVMSRNISMNTLNSLHFAWILPKAELTSSTSPGLRPGWSQSSCTNFCRILSRADGVIMIALVMSEKLFFTALYSSVFLPPERKMSSTEFQCR